jgi:hypothetical protein
VALSEIDKKAFKQATQGDKAPFFTFGGSSSTGMAGVTDFAPSWVMWMVALSLGLGTMIGWKRIVITIGEKIGKDHLTYAQGASAELIASLTIGLATAYKWPVSTTHMLKFRYRRNDGSIPRYQKPTRRNREKYCDGLGINLARDHCFICHLICFITLDCAG